MCVKVHSAFLWIKRSDPFTVLLLTLQILQGEFTLEKIHYGYSRFFFSFHFFPKYPVSYRNIWTLKFWSKARTRIKVVEMN